MHNSNSEFFRKIDERTNERMSSSLLLAVFAIPVVIILNAVGVFRLSLLGVLEFTIVSLFGLVSPRIMHKKGLPSEFVKYYIITTISIVVAIMATQPHIGIYITYVLGIVISLFYADVILTVYSSILTYCLMMAALYFREYNAILENPTDTVLHAWLAYGMGLTIEFAIIGTLFFALSKYNRKHTMREWHVMNELRHENERYNLALDNASDVLFEYDVIKEEFKYYGSLMPDEVNPIHTAKVIKKFPDVLRKGEFVYEDDIEKIISYFDIDCAGKLDVRLCINEEDTFWVEIEGTVFYDGDKQSRVIGKIRDINVAKIEEENRIVDGEGVDEITGFYERTTGIRIIRRFKTDIMQGYHCFVYADFVSGKIIRARAGSIFNDTIVMRLAGIFESELRSTDVAVRFSTDEFILYFQDRTPTMIEQTLERIKTQIAAIYVGEGIVEFLEVDFKVYDTIQELENDALNTDLIKDIEVREEYTDDVVFHAFNILEHAVNIDDAINELLERIGKRYSLDYVRILLESPVAGLQYCMNEWLNPDALEEPMYGEALSVQRMKKEPQLFVCDNKELGVDNMYIVFHGSGLDGDFRESICGKLREVAHIMSNGIMRFKFENASNSKTDFLSTMSHEIRTPMNSIAGFAELMLQENASGVMGEYANTILTSTHDLLHLINDILDISKMEAGKFDIVLVQYRLHEIIDEITSLMGIQLSKKPVSFETDIKDVPDGLIGDNVRIRQILVNLLTNAAKYTRVGNIVLSINYKQREDGGLLQISVKDTGIGIKEDEIEYVFDAYERADFKKNQETQGTGLGLNITKNLVELMGGEIGVKSEYGRGTEFFVEIPQSVFDDKSYDYSTKVGNTKKQAFVIPFTTVDTKALVVDDNMVNLKVAAGLISKYQIDVTTVKSGEEAIKTLKEDNNYDIVFMDHLMPGMDGIACTKIIRNSEDSKIKNIPIVALTANAKVGVEEEFAKAGMNGYLSKPINLRELCAVLESFLDTEKKIYINPENEE